MLEVNRDTNITGIKQKSLLPFEIAYTADLMTKREILDSMSDPVLLL